MGDPSSIRPWVAVVGSVVAFALLVERGGLIPATMVTVWIASLGSREIAVREALLLGGCLALAVTVLFVVLLRQPFRVLMTW